MAALCAVLVLASLTGRARAQAVDTISAVEVVGNQRIEPDTVRSYLRVKVGDAFDASAIDQALKALYATGLFADVTLRRQGDRLIVAVVENPVINQLAFEGNKRITDEALEAEVQLRPRVVYTRARVQADVQRIIRIYRRSGRFAATVEPKVVQLEQNRVDLIFEVNEGQITEIRKIRFLGNRAFSDSRLRREISTKESRWYRFLSSDDTYDPDRLTLDRELLRRFYLSRGHADFRVVSAVAELTPDREEFFITFTIEEGEVYRLQNVDLETQLKEVDVEPLRAFIRTQPGDVYNAELVDKTIEDLSFELGRVGFAFVNIRPRIKRNRESRTIDMVYEIGEGSRVYVERINISGNVRTLDNVIRREFRLAEGDAFNTAKLRRSRGRIRGLGFFDKVEISNEVGSAEDRTVINVEVQERSTGELSFGAGFSSAEAVVGDISIRERNLLGRGQDLKFSIGISAVRRQIDISFTEPYFLGEPISAGFDIFNIEADLQERSSFDQSQIGFTLRTGTEISERLRATLEYSLKLVEIKDVDNNASRVIREQEGETLTSEIGYRLRYDQRDDPIEPTSGYVLSFNQDFAGLGGDARFIRTEFDFGYYYALTETIISNLRFREGYIVGIGDDVRIDERFFLGGDSFRGFKSGGLGPRDVLTDDSLGGNLFYVGTAELRFPLGLPDEFGVTGRVFTEVGTLAAVDDDGAEVFDVGSVRVSAGFGLSWRSPFGPIRIDVSQALVKEEVDETEVLRFSFGTRF